MDYWLGACMTDMAKLNANMTQQWTRTIIKKIEDGRLQCQLIDVGDHGSREKGVWLYKLQAHEGELNQMGGDLESRTEVLDKKKKEHFGSKQDQDRWQNARWKNHEVMSWRDIKLQWWASISCFPFNFQLCGL